MWRGPRLVWERGWICPFVRAMPILKKCVGGGGALLFSRSQIVSVFLHVPRLSYVFDNCTFHILFCCIISGIVDMFL